LQERNATLVEGSFAGVSTAILVTTPREPSLPEKISYVFTNCLPAWCWQKHIACTVSM
jgi:hypothetical protein